MAQSAFSTHGEGYGVASETKSSYSSAFTAPITSDTYGQPIPISRGRRPVKGQLLFSTSVLQETKTTTTTYETTYSPFDAYEVHSGELVPPPAPDPVTTIETTKMLVDCAVGCGAPLNGEVTPRILEIRAGSTILYDASDETITQIVSTAMTLYNGSETQLPDPLIESYQGAGNVSAMRGEIYVVFQGLDLLAFGGTFPEFTFILSDDASGELAPEDLGGDIVDGSFLVPDWTRNLIYVKSGAVSTIEVWDAKRFAKIFDLATYDAIGGGNFDACYWLNYIIAFIDNGSGGEISVVDAATGLILSSDDELDDTWWHISQIVTQGTEAPIWYVLAGSFFGPMVLYELLDDGSLMIAGRNDDTDFMEAACRGLVSSGRSLIYTGQGSKIYKYEFSQATKAREPDGWGGYEIPFVRSGSDPWWIDLNDYDVAGAETVINIGQINYYGDNSLIIYARTSGSHGVVVKVGAEDGVVAWATFLTSHPPDISNYPGCHSRIVGSQLGIQENNGTFYYINCDTGEATNLGVSDPSAPGDYNLWDGETQSFWIELSADDKLKRVSGAVSAGGRLPLATLIEEISLFAGFEITDITIDPAITNIVDGFIMENGVDTDYWTLMRTWGSAFLYALYETGIGIEFRSVVEVTETPTYDFELTIADLATMQPTDFPIAEEDPASNAAIISTRAPDQDIVDYVKMTYKDIDYDFGDNTIYRQRARVPGDDYIKGKDLTISIPEIIMLTDEAASLVSNILFNEIAQRTTHEWRLPGVYGHTLPGDKYSITVGQFNYKIKVTTLTYHYDFSLSLLGRDYYSDVSLITTSGQTPYTPPPAPVQNSQSQIIVFDTPLLFTVDELGNDIISVYYGVAGMGQDGWQMSNVYRSTTGGFYELIDKVDKELIIGRATTVLADIGDYSTIDEYNSFELRLDNGNPEAFHTISDDSWFNGGFLAVIGAPGRWEVVSIKNFVPIDLDAGTFTCSMLIRGLRDTYMHMGSHAAGDRVIFPRANRARRLIREAAESYEETVLYKAAGSEQDVLSAPRASVPLSAEIQRPMSVVGYRAVKDSGDDDITLSWNRQSRLANPFSESGAEVSVNEFSEIQFLLEIKDGPAGSIVRTTTINAASQYIYTAANQITDGFATTPDRIAFQVTQQDDELAFIGRTVERYVIVEYA